MATNEPLIGSIELWPLKNPPEGWVFCDGQKLLRNDYVAASSLLFEIYGGDDTTFNIPNLNGRVPIGSGQLSNGEKYKLGTIGGEEKVLLKENEYGIKPHSHSATLNDPSFEVSVNATVKQKVRTGNVIPFGDPVESYLAKSTAKIFYNSPTPNEYMAPAHVDIEAHISKQEAGSIIIHENFRATTLSPHENRMPFIVLNFIIALKGDYPILDRNITKE